MGGSIAQARSRYNPVHHRRQLSAAARRAGRGARGAQSFNARGGDRLGGEPCHDAAGRLVVAASLARRRDRKSVVLGKSVSVLVDLGGRRCFKKKRTTNDN